MATYFIFASVKRDEMGMKILPIILVAGLAWADGPVQEPGQETAISIPDKQSITQNYAVPVNSKSFLFSMDGTTHVDPKIKVSIVVENSVDNGQTWQTVCSSVQQGGGLDDGRFSRISDVHVECGIQGGLSRVTIKPDGGAFSSSLVTATSKP